MKPKTREQKTRYEVRRQSPNQAVVVEERHNTERHAVLAFTEHLAYWLTGRHSAVGEYWAVVDNRTNEVVIDYAVGANK